MYPLPVLVTPFPNNFIIKGNANNRRNSPFRPFPVIEFVNEEAIGCINEEAIGAISEAAIGAIIAERNQPSCFFVLCFTVSLAPSINRPNFSNNSTILIISSVSLFEMNKVNPLPALPAPCPGCFFQTYLMPNKLLYLLIWAKYL